MDKEISQRLPFWIKEVLRLSEETKQQEVATVNSVSTSSIKKRCDNYEK